MWVQHRDVSLLHSCSRVRLKLCKGIPSLIAQLIALALQDASGGTALLGDARSETLLDPIAMK